MGFTRVTTLIVVLVAFSQPRAAAHGQQASKPIDWKRVDAALGKPGAIQPDGAYKAGLPRSDLHVSVGGVAIKPALALGSWVALKQVSDSDAMLMGDLVLLQSEVGPVLAKLQEGGIEFVELQLTEESPANGRTLNTIVLPEETAIPLLIREGRPLVVGPDTVFEPGDKIVAVTTGAQESSLQSLVLGR